MSILYRRLRIREVMPEPEPIREPTPEPEPVPEPENKGKFGYGLMIAAAVIFSKLKT